MKMIALLPLALLSACGSPQRSAPSTPVQDIRSTSITLPAEPTVLPSSAPTVALNCTACHSGEMILSQPPLDARKWQGEIDKMRSVYKASIDPAQDEQLVGELIALQRIR